MAVMFSYVIMSGVELGNNFDAPVKNTQDLAQIADRGEIATGRLRGSLLPVFAKRGGGGRGYLPTSRNKTNGDGTMRRELSYPLADRGGEHQQVHPAPHDPT